MAVSARKIFIFAKFTWDLLLKKIIKLVFIKGNLCGFFFRIHLLLHINLSQDHIYSSFKFLDAVQ